MVLVSMVVAVSFVRMVMIVIMIIAILAAIAVPMYKASVRNARETVLRDNLITMRRVIDQSPGDVESYLALERVHTVEGLL